MQDALSNSTSVTYDTDGNVTAVTDPLSHATNVGWDSLSRITSVTDALSNSESISYDAWGRPDTTTHPDTTAATVQYDLNGRVTQSTDENGHSTTFAYDDAGRVTSVTNARGDIESYGYDDADRCNSVINGRGKTRTYTYTARGEVSSLTMPDSTVESWSYNGNGDTTAYTNQLSQTISYTYDDAGRHTGIDYPTGADVSFTYDNANRRTQMVDSTGTTSWTYDNAGRVTQLVTPQGTMSYTYNDDGSRASMTDSSGTTTYTYNAAGNLVSLENQFGEETTWTYDNAGRTTRQTFDSGAYTAYGYDARNRVTTLEHKTSANALISGEAYEYDDAGNMTEKTVDSVVTAYGYDPIDQLTSEVRTGYSAAYTYDSNGNRLTKTLNGVTDSYSYSDCDELDQIIRGGVTIKSYTYDDAGRTTAVTAGGNTTTLGYDYEGRITTITYPNTSTNTFTYNTLDTRVGKVDSAGTFTYKRDGVGVTAPVLADGAATYTPGISERRSSTTKFYHQDYLGTSTRVINSSQSTTDTKQFDAFGNIVASSGLTATPFAFAGRWGYQSESDSGLHLLGHRYYDSSTGRFLSRDRAYIGRNWYVYCNNNPINNTDSNGLGSNRIAEQVELAFIFGEEAVGLGLGTTAITAGEALLVDLAIGRGIIAMGFLFGGLVAIAIDVATGRSEPPGDAILWRWGPGPESQDRLQDDVNRSIGAGYPPGVSVNINPHPKHGGREQRVDVIIRSFPIMATGKEGHFTIVLGPKITPEITKRWNDLFPPVTIK